MNRRTIVCFVALLIALSLSTGCSRDPNVRKQKYLASGQRYMEKGKYQEAAIQFSNALQVDRNLAEAHYQLAQAYLKMGTWSSAFGELSRTVELQPQNIKPRIDMGNLLLAARQIDKAGEQAAAIIAIDPNNPDAHALLSGIASAKGKKDEALAEINRALELDPNRANFHTELALLQVSDPANDASVESHLKSAVALDPKGVSSRMVLAAFYAKNKRWAEAEPFSREAINIDQKSVTARTSLAGIYLQQGNAAKAEEVLRQASADLSDNPQGVRLLADYLANSGQVDRAVTEFANLTSRYPKNVAVKKGYVKILLQTKNFAKAQTLTSELVKDHAADPEVNFLNGLVLLNSGKSKEAVEQLQKAAKNDPQNGQVRFWLSKAAAAAGDLTTAEKELREAGRITPNAINVQEGLFQMAVAKGDVTMLSEVADRTIAALPQFPGGFVWRAIVELNRAHPEKAEADLNTAITVGPTYAPAYVKLGQLRFSQKKFPEGVKLLEQALQIDANSAEALRGLVTYDLYLKQPAKAQARVSDQIAKVPPSSPLLVMLAALQIDSKELDKADANLLKAMQLDSADPNAASLYTRVQIMRGDVGKAVTVWEQWSKAHPQNAQALALIGTLEESRGNRDKASGYYQRALQIQPDQPVAANNLAYLMIETDQNIDVALSLAQTARRAMPDAPSAADTLAWAYYHKGTYASARDLLEQAVKGEPENATMHYHLGMAYSKLSDKKNATIHLKKALSLAPNTPTATQAEKALQNLG